MLDPTGAPNARREDDPVVITTRDIYTLAAATAGKVDSVLAMVTTAQSTDADHEARIRKLETRYYGIIGTLGLAAATVTAWVLTDVSQRI
jgi:hypothetical protein